jgi:hypothetical protein
MQTSARCRLLLMDAGDSLQLQITTPLNDVPCFASRRISECNAINYSAQGRCHNKLAAPMELWKIRLKQTTGTAVRRNRPFSYGSFVQAD